MKYGTREDGQVWERGNEFKFGHISDTSTRRQQENSQICGHGALRRDLGWRFKSIGYLHMVIMHKEEVWTRM